MSDLPEQFMRATVHLLPLSGDLSVDRAGMCERCSGSKVYRLDIMVLGFFVFDFLFVCLFFDL